MTLDWRKLIADSGGMESAMLHGEKLARLAKHIETMEQVEAVGDEACKAACDAMLKAERRAAEAERLLAVERAELVRLSNLVEPVQRRLAAVEEVVAAAYNEAAKGVVTARLSAALAALSAQDQPS